MTDIMHILALYNSDVINDIQLLKATVGDCDGQHFYSYDYESLSFTVQDNIIRNLIYNDDYSVLIYDDNVKGWYDKYDGAYIYAHNVIPWELLQQVIDQD